jgi:hypothetical protein
MTGSSRVLLSGLLFLAGCSNDAGRGPAAGASGAGGAGAGASGATSGGGSTLAGTGGRADPSGGASGGGKAGGGGAGGSSGSQQLTVSAGNVDRHHAIVSFSLASLAGKSFSLSGPEGEVLPLQVSSDGAACFVLPELLAGQERTYTVQALDIEPAAAVSSVQGASDVKLAIGATQVVRFQAQGQLPSGVAAVYLRGGYLHPLYSPSGIVVTGDYPPSHVHHHGIWSAWTRAQFNGHAVDFWNMADGLGKVDFDSLGALWQGPVHAGFEAELVHVDLVGAEPTTALTEHWKVTAYETHDQAPPYLVFDLESVQKAATAMPVALEEYIYGGFGMRGVEEWLDKAKVTFLTSEGFDRLGGDAKNARWVFIGGTVQGSPAGYAVLGHPQNFRAPQPFRIHPDEPYASIAPPKAGAFSIEPGQDYVTRFRIVTIDGAPDAALFDSLWDDYATPASVTLD